MGIPDRGWCSRTVSVDRRRISIRSWKPSALVDGYLDELVNYLTDRTSTGTFDDDCSLIEMVFH